MKGIAFKRLLLTLAGVALLLGLGPPKAQAQESWDDPTFSSFTQTTLVSGFTFTINSVNVTNASQVGTNGDYVFGFSSTNTPIVINFGSAANDPFGGVRVQCQGVGSVVGQAGADVPLADQRAQHNWIRAVGGDGSALHRDDEFLAGPGHHREDLAGGD